MPLLSPDSPFGQPAFALNDDQIATVIELICQGTELAKPHLSPGLGEVPTTMIVRKAMRNVKKTLGLSNLQIRGEHELENMAAMDPSILGRIDITLQFLHQFGDEDAYVAIECKRVGAGSSALNNSYVDEGVDRFVSGKYAAGHEWGFMLGYVLAHPVGDVVEAIDSRIQKAYGGGAGLCLQSAHTLSMAILEGALLQASAHTIRLKHLLVDMTVIAKPS